MVRKSVAIDPGSHTTKVLALRDGKRGLEVTAFASFPAEHGEEGLAATGIPLNGVVAGLAGRDMTLRYTQVPPAPDWQIRNLMALEIEDLANQSGDVLSADYNLLPVVGEEVDGETVLMALAREEALDSVASQVGSAGGSIAAHVPNCIAIYNAYLRTYPTEEDEVVCIANLGHETADIALAKGQDLLFARNLSQGGKVIDESIASAFNVSTRKAQSLKRELLDLDPASRGKFASGQAEKVTMAAGGSATMLVSAIQSSLAFCKSQTQQPDLQLDKVLLCGGSSRLKGITGLLREALHCPVEIFDPFGAVDLTGLQADELNQLESNRQESVVALGLAATILDSSLYSLEILPEAVKRRQRFLRRTIYNVGAAAVLLVVLGMMVVTGVEEVEAVESARITANRTRRRVLDIHDQAAALVEANNRKRVLIEDLVRRSVGLDGTLRVLRALQDMPEDLWLDSVGVVQEQTGRAGQRKPVVQIDGQGLEISGREIRTVYDGFSAALKRRTGIGTSTQSGFEIRDNQINFAFTFDLFPDPELVKDTEEQELDRERED